VGGVVFLDNKSVDLIRTSGSGFFDLKNRLKRFARKSRICILVVVRGNIYACVGLISQSGATGFRTRSNSYRHCVRVVSGGLVTTESNCEEQRKKICSICV